MKNPNKPEKKQGRGGDRGGSRPVGRNQKSMTFRINFENLAYLDSMPNKGGYLNKLIELDRNSKK